MGDLSIILSASLISFALASGLDSLSYFSSFRTPGIGLIGMLGLIEGSPIESGTVSWHIATPLSPPRAGSDTAPPLLLKELQDALAGTSNLSAPGPSGVGDCPLKWVVGTYALEVLDLFNTCLRLGHHPKCWRATKVVMLRKPNKKDPFSPRSYRPITLEETLGKLLEKMIANRLQFLANTRGWLPPN